MKQPAVSTLAAAAAAALLLPCAASAQTIERMKLTDGELTCAQIHAEVGQMEAVQALNATTPQAPLAQQARARKEFLTGFFVQRGCRLSALGATPPAATLPAAAPFAPPSAGVQPAGALPATAALPAAPTASDWRRLLQAPIVPLEGMPPMRGSASLKGKRFYISEYRVMFEVGGSVTATTRAAYLGGTNYGATRMSVEYQVPRLDQAMLQAITDRAYADFLFRLESAGFRPEPADAIARDLGGVVYEATVEPSRPNALVTEESDLGYGKRRYVVMAPTGMKLNPRGLAGLGAGNIGARINYTKGNAEGVSVSLAVNLAAQESSGGGSSLFRSGSSAAASAAMEVSAARNHATLTTHAGGGAVYFGAPLAVPGQFATLKETGGYDSRQDAAVAGLNALAARMGVAANTSRKVEMVVDVDPAAMAQMALRGLATVNQTLATGLR